VPPMRPNSNAAACCDVGPRTSNLLQLFIPPAMQNAISRDRRKQRLRSGPKDEQGDKRRRTCCPNECKLTTRVSTLESTVSHLAAQIGLLIGELPTSSTFSIPTEAPARYTCPASNCARDFVSRPAEPY
jgi:hypothetical protein